MANRKKLQYKDIESTPANRLMELSYEQLDSFSAEAQRILHNAEAIMDWLKAIKTMKAARARSNSINDGSV